MDAGSGWTIATEVGTLALGMLVAAVGATWAVGRNNDAIIDKLCKRMDAKHDILAAEQRSMERRLDDRIDNSGHDVGESLTAMRTKIGEVEQNTSRIEIWNRDNFVSKSTFTAVIQQTNDFLRRFEDKIDKRFDKTDDTMKDIGEKLEDARTAALEAAALVKRDRS